MIHADNEKTPSSAVGFLALGEAKKQGADFCILDTAGRLHNNENLMRELVKCKKVFLYITQIRFVRVCKITEHQSYNLSNMTPNDPLLTSRMMKEW